MKNQKIQSSQTHEYLKTMSFWFFIASLFIVCTWGWNIFALYINIRPPVGEKIISIFHNPADIFYFAISLYFAIIVKLIYFIIFSKYRKCDEHGLIKNKTTSYLFYTGWIVLALGILCSWLGFFIAGELGIEQISWFGNTTKIRINPVQLVSFILITMGLLFFILFGNRFRKLNS